MVVYLSCFLPFALFIDGKNMYSGQTCFPAVVSTISHHMQAQIPFFVLVYFCVTPFIWKKRRAVFDNFRWLAIALTYSRNHTTRRRRFGGLQMVCELLEYCILILEISTTILGPEAQSAAFQHCISVAASERRAAFV
jgi:hypothetical protein